MKPKTKSIVFSLGVGATSKGVGCFGPFGIVTLQSMKTPGEIGGDVADSNLTGPEVRILFATPEAVERFIAELRPIARMMCAVRRSLAAAPKKLRKKPLETTANAPANNSPRRSNKQRKIPGTRAKR